jgi:hypothetical protein
MYESILVFGFDLAFMELVKPIKYLRSDWQSEVLRLAI